MEIEQVTGGGSDEEEEDEEDEESVESFGTGTEAEEGFESPAGKEGEELQVVLHQQIEQDEPEGKGTEPLTDLIVEQ